MFEQLYYVRKAGCFTLEFAKWLECELFDFRQFAHIDEQLVELEDIKAMFSAFYSAFTTNEEHFIENGTVPITTEELDAFESVLDSIYDKDLKKSNEESRRDQEEGRGFRIG